MVMFRFGSAERQYPDYQREHSIWDRRLHQPNPSDPLYSRGWVLQEEVLAPRSVRFSRDQLRWECRHTLQSEDGTLAKPYTTYLYPEEVTPFSFQKCIESSRIWNSWFCDILSREFTFHDDRPAAMAGLVEFYREKTQFTPLLAEWKETLIQDLTWDADRQKMTVPPSERSPFPSWSQFSIPPLTDIFYEPVCIEESDDIKTEVEILEASVYSEGSPFTSKFSRSKLVVSGRVLPIRELEVEIRSSYSNLPYEIAFLKNWLTTEAFDYVTQNENVEDVMLLHLMQRISSDSIFCSEETKRVLEDLLLIIIPVSLDPLVCYRLGKVFHPCFDFDEKSPNQTPTIFTRGMTRTVELI
jgi:hypothetical protein